jgi:hypothetical protein
VPKPGYTDAGSVIEKICEFYYFKMGFRDSDELQYEQVKEGYPIRCRLFAAVKSFHMEGKWTVTISNRLGLFSMAV